MSKATHNIITLGDALQLIDRAGLRLESDDGTRFRVMSGNQILAGQSCPMEASEVIGFVVKALVR